MAHFAEIVEGTTSPKIELLLTHLDNNGDRVPIPGLSGANAITLAWESPKRAQILQTAAVCALEDEPTARISYQQVAADVAHPGDNYLQVTVDWDGAGAETVIEEQTLVVLPRIG